MFRTPFWNRWKIFQERGLRSSWPTSSKSSSNTDIIMVDCPPSSEFGQTRHKILEMVDQINPQAKHWLKQQNLPPRDYWPTLKCWCYPGYHGHNHGPTEFQTRNTLQDSIVEAMHNNNIATQKDLVLCPETLCNVLLALRWERNAPYSVLPGPAVKRKEVSFQCRFSTNDIAKWFDGMMIKPRSITSYYRPASKRSSIKRNFGEFVWVKSRYGNSVGPRNGVRQGLMPSKSTVTIFLFCKYSPHADRGH